MGYMSSVGYRGAGGTNAGGNQRMLNVNNNITKIASEFEHVTLVDISGIITEANYAEKGYFAANQQMITPSYDAHVEIAKILQKALDSQFKVPEATE